MKTPNLFDEARKLARRNDPMTSKLGALDAAKRLGELQAETLRCVQGTPGKTATELAWSHAVPDPRKFNRRLPELEKLGLVTRGAPRQCKITRRMAATWYPKDGAR